LAATWLRPPLWQIIAYGWSYDVLQREATLQQASLGDRHRLH